MMGRTYRAALGAILVMTMVAVPASAQRVLDQIIARVNADVILKSEYEALLAQRRQELGQSLQGAQLEAALEEERRHTLRSMIDQALLLQVARDLGINADLEVVKQMEALRQDVGLPTLEALEEAIVAQGGNVDTFKEQIRNRFLTEQVVGRQVYPKINISNEEIRNYYETHQQDFDKPAGVQILEIFVVTEGMTPEQVAGKRAKIEEALAAIRNGEDFGETATKFSESDTAQRGGDLGFFEAGQLNETLTNAIEPLQRGQVSDIIDVSDGLMILKVLDRHSGGILSFEIAKDQIEGIIFQTQAEPRYREYLTQLRRDGFVEVREGYADTGAAAAPGAQ